jgi:hypothetical protein
VRLRAWQETKDQRPILTGDGMITPVKGDLVAVLVIERWDNFEAAIEALRKLYQSKEP